MFWSMSENAGGFRHLLDSWCRVALKQQNTRYYDILRTRGQEWHLVADEDDQPIGCKYCGFAQVRLTLSSGWDVEVCSSQAFRNPLDAEKLEHWARSLPSSSGVTVELK